jgi:cytochrome c peroxidase
MSYQVAAAEFVSGSSTVFGRNMNAGLQKFVGKNTDSACFKGSDLSDRLSRSDFTTPTPKIPAFAPRGEGARMRETTSGLSSSG